MFGASCGKDFQLFVNPANRQGTNRLTDNSIKSFPESMIEDSNAKIKRKSPIFPIFLLTLEPYTVHLTFNYGHHPWTLHCHSGGFILCFFFPKGDLKK
jgi:hypothetical protein